MVTRRCSRIGIAVAAGALSMAFAAAQEAPVPTPPATRELDAARAATADPQLVGWLAKTLAAKSYAFHHISDGAAGERPAGGERGRRGGERPAVEGGGRTLKCDGAWQAGSPARLVQGALVAYRIDDQFVSRRGESPETPWERYDEGLTAERMAARRSRDPGAQNGEGEGGAAPAGGAGTAPTGGSPPTAGGATPAGGTLGGGIPLTGAMQLRNVMALAGVKLPHEILARLPTGLVDVVRREADDKAFVTATATPELAEFLAGSDRLSRMAAQAGRRGGGAPITATVALRFAADGRLEQLTVETIVHSERRGEQRRTLTWDLSAYETTQYEVPKAALDLLAT